MTTSQALNSTKQKLKQNKIPTPRLDAEILLSHILKKTREYLFTNPEKKLSKSRVTRYALCVTRRVKGEPIAYITGHKEFYGLDFFVNKNVLVPRPETELMVDETLRITRNAQRITLIDVGTGSGCVIISLAKLLNKNLKADLKANKRLFAFKSAFKFLATDISKPALTIARKNAKLHHADKKIKFLHGNLLKPILNNPKYLEHPNNPIIITANLPYGWNSWKNNCSMETIGLKFEPPIALFTENKGLKIIENLLKQIKQLARITNHQSQITALIEFDPRQTFALKQLIKKIIPNAKTQIKKDLNGLNRLAIISTRL